MAEQITTGKINEGEEILASWVSSAVEQAKETPTESWKPGDKLKILLVGYNGKKNTGADVRVAAMVQQFYHILGKDNIEIGVITFEPEKSQVYFGSETKLEQLNIGPSIFEDMLKIAAQYHIGVLSEGSTLKSKWSNSLTLFFACAMGIMKNLNKPCIAYGSGAGQMDEWIYNLAKEYGNKTFFICREKQSLELVKNMGMEAEMGVDTAWTFAPASSEWAEQHLNEKTSWDGKKPILGVAVINPFCWPVVPDFEKFTSQYWEEHPTEWYEGFMFFTWNEERERLYMNYLTSIATAVDKFAKKYDMQVVIFGMEALDHPAVTKFQSMLNVSAEYFSAVDYDGFQITALLRKLTMLVTSRYHARVLSMATGVPSIAVSMDERLYNLLYETGHLNDYYLQVDDLQLNEKLYMAMEKLYDNREKIQTELLKSIPYYLKSMANMGKIFRAFVKRNFPQFPMPMKSELWTEYLPELEPTLKVIIEKYGE